MECDTAGYLEIDHWSNPSLYFGYQSTLPLTEEEKETIEPRPRIGFV